MRLRECAAAAARYWPSDAIMVTTNVFVTDVEFVVSRGCSGGSDGQASLGEAAVYEVTAVLDVP
jgi:hypothetical protein